MESGPFHSQGKEKEINTDLSNSLNCENVKIFLCRTDRGVRPAVAGILERKRDGRSGPLQHPFHWPLNTVGRIILLLWTFILLASFMSSYLLSAGIIVGINCIYTFFLLGETFIQIQSCGRLLILLVDGIFLG